MDHARVEQELAADAGPGGGGAATRGQVVAEGLETRVLGGKGRPIRRDGDHSRGQAFDEPPAFHDSLTAADVTDRRPTPPAGRDQEK